jgi:hypothetical protein
MRVHKSAWHLSLAQAVHREIVAKVYKLLRNQTFSREGQLPYAAVSGTVYSSHGNPQITTSIKQLEDIGVSSYRAHAYVLRLWNSHFSILSSY